MTQEPDRDEIVEYIASMLGQLQTMARASNNDLLAYLIGMAHLEAANDGSAKPLSSRNKRDSAA